MPIKIEVPKRSTSGFDAMVKELLRAREKAIQDEKRRQEKEGDEKKENADPGANHPPGQDQPGEPKGADAA